MPYGEQTAGQAGNRYLSQSVFEQADSFDETQGGVASGEEAEFLLHCGRSLPLTHLTVCFPVEAQ
jgi:hypothetical protein